MSTDDRQPKGTDAALVGQDGRPTVAALSLDQSICDAIKAWLREEAPIGARENVHNGHIFWLMTRIKAALPQAPADGWQDISTAPKDGTRIDLYGPSGRFPNCRWGRHDAESRAPWGEEHWRGVPFYRLHGIEQQAPVTHWRPLPAPPVIAEEREVKSCT